MAAWIRAHNGKAGRLKLNNPEHMDEWTFYLKATLGEILNNSHLCTSNYVWLEENGK